MKTVQEYQKAKEAAKNEIWKCDAEIYKIQSKCKHTDLKRDDEYYEQEVYDGGDSDDSYTILEREVTCLVCGKTLHEVSKDDGDTWSF